MRKPAIKRFMKRSLNVAGDSSVNFLWGVRPDVVRLRKRRYSGFNCEKKAISSDTEKCQIEICHVKRVI